MKPESTAGLLYRLAWLFARLPWPLLAALADALAWLWRAIDARESRVTRRNLELAYPQLAPAEREALRRAVLRSTARQAMETLRLWSRPPAWNLAHCLVERHGQAVYDAALAAGRGVIVAAPHFGNWELLNQWLSERGPVTIVYKAPASPVGDAFLRRVRGAAANIHQVRAEGPAVRQLFKAVRAGGAVGILPDQQPKAGDGVFVPFFGVQALTMTLLTRLAQHTGATVLLAWCERIGPMRFALHVEPAPAAMLDPDLDTAVAALNAQIERIARRDPAQYQWTYKRYTLRPPGSGEANPYATARHPH
jgi:KDO2-lipid IV(A) lauroyltransferase